MTKRERETNALLAGDVDHDRPTTRGECMAMERPCPYFSCRHNLFLDVSPTTGNIKFNFPGLDFDELPETCALDVADQDGMSLSDVGELLNVTRERIRMIEVEALTKVLKRRGLEGHSESCGESGLRAFARAARETAA